MRLAEIKIIYKVISKELTEHERMHTWENAERKRQVIHAPSVYLAYVMILNDTIELGRHAERACGTCICVLSSRRVNSLLTLNKKNPTRYFDDIRIF